MSSNGNGGERARRILVVEDDLSILTGLSMNLKFEGYEVLQAQDGRTGLARALDETPDLVVLDVMLPQMNGYEVLRELRERGRDTAVVMLTAKGLERDKILGLNLGADDYVVKPFGLQELLARIKAVLRRRFPTRPAARRRSPSGTTWRWTWRRRPSPAAGAPWSSRRRSSSCSPTSSPTRGAPSAATSCSPPPGATTTRAARAPWTTSCASCGSSSSRTPRRRVTSSPCGASATASIAEQEHRRHAMHRRYTIHRDGDLLVEELDAEGKVIDPEPVPPEDRLPVELTMLAPDGEEAKAQLLDLLELALGIESEGPGESHSKPYKFKLDVIS
jgi:CheY-like chemotaxis protein